MGCKGKEKKPAQVAGKHSSHTKIRCKEKQLSANSCQCAQRFDTSFPYKDLPPPAPPDGRTDLWDLQFCRWWGWNWVRKRDSLVESETNTKEPKKPCLASKCRGWAEEDEIPTKDKSDSDPGPSKVKKASFSCKEPEIRQCQQPPMTAKEQFKAMCKCLLGKKNMNSGVAKLYNTPSNSMVAFSRQDRECYGLGEKSQERASKHKSHGKSCKTGGSKEHRCKGKSGKKSSPGEESTTPVSEQSIISDVQCESLYTQRRESSTEESIEYLTFRLQHATKTDNYPCPCQSNNEPPEIQEQQVAVETDPIEDFQMVACVTDTKETQTCPSVAKRENKYCGPSLQNCPYSEKRVKLKGKKEKTICIMVCCCGSCQKLSKNLEKNNDPEVPTSKSKCSGGCPKKINDTSAKPEKDDDKNKFLGDNTNFETVDTFATFPLAVSPLHAKKLSKFGTPSKNYPWMQNTGSGETTTSLNNIENLTSRSSDIYDWLKPDTDITNTEDSLKLPDLIDITENLSYLKKVDTSSKTNEEDRILLDAVCDAILKEHDDNTCQLFDEFEFHTKDELNMNYKDLGVFCDLKNDKTDVYTALSRALVNTEDIGVQLTKAMGLSSILDRSDASRLDTMVSNIMDSIFSKSKDSVCNGSQNSFHPNDPSSLECEIKECTEYTASPNEETTFQFSGADVEFAKAGVMPYRAPTTFRRPIKRGATGSETEENWCKKKIKQGDAKCCNNLPTNSKIGDIFNKIEDIVLKSKAKTAELEKVLNVIPKKQELSNKTSENVLQIHNLSQKGTKLEFAQSSTDNILQFETLRNASRRNYPMSSDTFKGTLCEALSKRCDLKNLNLISKNASQTYCGIPPQPILEEQAHTEQHNNIINTEDMNCPDVENKHINKPHLLNQKLSKLSVQSFIVCDEKSKVASKSSPSCPSGSLMGKKSLRNNFSRASLIPIRRRSNTDC